jgi:hypothetical protein
MYTTGSENRTLKKSLEKLAVRLPEKAARLSEEAVRLPG